MLNALLGQFRTTFVAALIGVLIGIAVGFYVKHKFALAELHEAIAEQRKEDAHAVANMQAKEAALQAQLDEARTTIETIQREVQPRVIYRPARSPKGGNVGISVPGNEQHGGVPAPSCEGIADGVDSFLDAGTVRLLNDARAGSLGSPSGVDAEGEAAAEVSIYSFVQNDLEVVGMYHDLAIRHDALVEWVEGLIEKQQKK